MSLYANPDEIVITDPAVDMHIGGTRQRVVGFIALAQTDEQRRDGVVSWVRPQIILGEGECTLWDRYAVAALSGLASGIAGNTASMAGAMEAAKESGRTTSSQIARSACAMASAMLAERKKRMEEGGK